MGFLDLYMAIIMGPTRPRIVLGARRAGGSGPGVLEHARAYACPLAGATPLFGAAHLSSSMTLAAHASLD